MGVGWGTKKGEGEGEETWEQPQRTGSDLSKPGFLSAEDPASLALFPSPPKGHVPPLVIWLPSLGREHLRPSSSPAAVL